MKRGSSTEILSQTTSSLGAQSKIRTAYSLLISVWPNATRIRRGSTFLSERGKTWLGLPDTRALTPTLGMNSLDAMTWRPSATYSFTSSAAVCHGRDFQAEARMRNTTILRKRRWKWRLTSCARATPRSSGSSWTTAGSSSSPMTPTTSIWLGSSKGAWRRTDGTPRPLTSSGTKTGFS